ncbi:AAA family ATPase [Ensifer sp. ENS12]|uniref:AAA family ATPase n=1 Tax=Ensifer sp. ENS12 TaxID=2854774 RepID=UPI000DD63A4E|nr:AAA family ATPase [Ensifer sp. ENS12]MBV7517367.1 AAA family ATPase [Ensifer sp. ENS12]
MQQPPLGILIAGSSHVGKSTLARALASSLGRELISTDDLGRHPGRPWPSVRPQVAEYYASLSDETIHWFLKDHHENMWPRIRQIIESHRQLAKPFVLEGAALRPEYVAQLEPGSVAAVFLYADEDFLRRRMMEEAGHSDADEATAAIIAKFIERSIRENRDMLEAAQAANIRCVDVAAPGTLDKLMKAFSAA